MPVEERGLRAVALGPRSPHPPAPSSCCPQLTKEVSAGLAPAALLCAQAGLQGQHRGQRGLSCLLDALPHHRHLRRLAQAALGQRHIQRPWQGVLMSQKSVSTTYTAHHLGRVWLKGLAQEEAFSQD